MNSNEFNHPTDENGRYLCSTLNPMPQVKPEKSRWSHPDAIETEEDYGKGGGVADGDFVKSECPNCKFKWSELPN